MAAESGLAVLSLGAGEPRYPRGTQPRGGRSFPDSRRTHNPGHPVESHDPARFNGPGGRAGVLAPLAGELGKLFPGGPECTYQGTGSPDPGVRLAWRQELAEEQPDRETRKEYTLPPDRSHTGGHQGTRRWTRLWGITGAEILVRGDRIYVTSNHGPVSLDHVALAGRVGGTDFSNESVLSTFPYLQLLPPYCYTCFC